MRGISATQIQTVLWQILFATRTAWLLHDITSASELREADQHAFSILGNDCLLFLFPPPAMAPACVHSNLIDGSEDNIDRARVSSIAPAVIQLQQRLLSYQSFPPSAILDGSPQGTMPARH